MSWIRQALNRHTLLIVAFRGLRQEDYHGFEASLGYLVSYRQLVLHGETPSLNIKTELARRLRW